MRNRALVSLVLLSSLWYHPSVRASEDCLPLLTAQVVKALGSHSDTVFRLAAKGGTVSDGLATALRARPEDGALRVKQIIDHFGEPVSANVFDILSLVKTKPGLSDLIVNLAKQDVDAQAASATLRYVTSVIQPNAVARFEFPVGDRVADVLLTDGNLLEFKSLNLETYSDFVAEQEFLKTYGQLRVFEDYAASQGKTVLLVFENAVPAVHQARFDEIFGEMLERGVVGFRNGF